MNMSNDDTTSRILEGGVTFQGVEFVYGDELGLGIMVGDTGLNTLIELLPSITEKDLEELGQKDSSCSVCMQPFTSIIAEQEMAAAMESPAYYSGELGVTRLDRSWQCGHLFCRRDITKWIQTGKSTCPMCRKSLVDPADAALVQQEGDDDVDYNPEDDGDGEDREDRERDDNEVGVSENGGGPRQNHRLTNLVRLAGALGVSLHAEDLAYSGMYS